MIGLGDRTGYESLEELNSTNYYQGSTAKCE
jgi:hypothetical protein